MPKERSYRSVRAQALHYLARPHREPALAPVREAAAWHRIDVADSASWTYELEAADIAEIEEALRLAPARDLSLLRARDVPLAGLESRLRSWRRCLGEGRGFLRIRGVPVERWQASQVERFFWALGLHLGRPGAQNGEGELLGHVRDLRLGRDGEVRQYKTREEIHYHCDAADVVGLLCVKTALRGGLSRIASSVAIFNRIVESRPDLSRLLFEPMYFDARGDGGTDAFSARPCAYFGGRLRTFYHAEYMRTASRHSGIPELTGAQHELLDLYDALANSPEFHLLMELRPGDIQLISNHSVVHSRTAYTDHQDLAQQRHLLRLWLSLDSVGSMRESALRAFSLAELMAALANRKISSWAGRI